MRRPAGGHDRRQRGFALLVVLWAMSLLALLGTQLMATARSDTQLAHNLLDQAVLEAATDGAIQQAVFHMLEQRWTADGTTRVIRQGAIAISIDLEDEAGKVNPNIASAALLRGLLAKLGEPPAIAASLADAIIDWRTEAAQPRPNGAKAPQYAAAGRDYGPPGSEFRSIDELAAVLGMTPALLARLQPHITLYSDADPDGTTRDPVVAAALGEPTAMPGDAGAPLQTATVTARATGPGGTAFVRRAVVRLNGAASRHPYEMLALQQVAAGTARDR